MAAAAIGLRVGSLVLGRRRAWGILSLLLAALLAHALSSGRASVSAATQRDTPQAGVDVQRPPGRAAMRVRFGPSRVSIDSGTLRLSMGVEGVGDGASLRSVGQPHLRLSAGRASYGRAGLSEWYVNRPSGLEQGFTIDRRPSASATGGPLTISLGLAGNGRASLAAGRRSVVFTGPGGSSLRYGGLTATDAAGRRLVSWIALGKRQILLRVAANHARYPLRIDPLVQQGPKLTGQAEAGAGRLGAGVALSEDGSTALVGAPGDNAEAGAAWVFTRAGATWVQQGAKLLPNAGEESAGGELGAGVALSADGNTALVGAPTGTTGGAWVFTRSGAAWTQQGPKLLGAEVSPGLTGADFGYRVALSADGNTALIGAYNDNDGAGAAWVFTRSGSTWSQQGPELLAGSGEGLHAGGFGSSVALSADGSTALIGQEEGSSNGSAYVFTRSGSTWSQQGSKLQAASGEPSEGLGVSAALSADGNTALIGGVNATLGAAWVFTRSGSSWSQQGPQLTGESEEKGTGHLGASVALSADGNTALIGAFTDKLEVPGPSPEELPFGSAFVFTRSDSTWSRQTPKLTAQLGEETLEGRLGRSVALSGDGQTALAGAPNDSGEAGAAWVFATPAVAVAAPLVTTTQTPPVTVPPPVISHVSQSHSRWREGKRLASLASASHAATPPIGTTFSFTLNEPATVEFEFTRQLGGRSVGGKCVAQTSKNRDKRACKRTIVQGELSRAAQAGKNGLSFQGLISSSKSLALGANALVLTAVNAARQRSRAQSLNFTVVK